MINREGLAIEPPKTQKEAKKAFKLEEAKKAFKFGYQDDIRAIQGLKKTLAPLFLKVSSFFRTPNKEEKIRDLKKKMSVAESTINDLTKTNDINSNIFQQREMEKLLALRRKLKKQHFAIFQENESFYRLKPESYDSGKLEGLFKDLKGLNVTPDHATIEKITGDLLDKWDIAYDRVSFNKNNDEYRYHELGYLKIRENSVNGDSFEVVIEYNMLDTTEKTEGFATTYNNHISSAGIGYKTSCTYHDLNYCSCIPSLCRLTKRKACSKNSVH